LGHKTKVPLNDGFKVFPVKPEPRGSDVIRLPASRGNPVRTRSLERTIRDVAGSRDRMDPEILSNAVKRHVGPRNGNISPLLRATRRLGVVKPFTACLEVPE
jgi:hypothetical protein